MDKSHVATILDEIGTLLELKGENKFKCLAYKNAARTISGLSEDLQTLVVSGEIKKIKGIGEALSEKITELVTTGKLQYYDELKSEFPESLFKILQIQGLGPKKVKILYEKLQIHSIEQLEAACKEHTLEHLDGFGKKTEENILAGIETLQKYSTKFLYSVAETAAKEIFQYIFKQKGVIRAEIAGSLRRKKEIIGDIDIVLSAQKKETQNIMKAFTSHPGVQRITGEGETKSSVILNSGIHCDVRIVNDAEFPFTLNYFTGSKEHNVRIRSLAKNFGLSLNEYGFSRIDSDDKKGKTKKNISCINEENIYSALGLEYVPPELREDMGEIESAQNKTLPMLISENDIRGTFHCHTNYSDGTNTLFEMASAAQKKGWEYIGIADHSKIAVYANGLSEQRVKQQHKEIDSLNQTLSNFRIFKGIEVDILSNGELDFSDKVLSSFDFVVASVHSIFKMTEEEMTKRILKAVKNKYVTMLGHLTGRLLLQRDGYPLNQTTIINAASEYGKIIEINAHPSRLDLDWRMCKYAKEKGVRISINPDAHSTDGLNNVRYGVGIARKGWLEKKDVINIMNLKTIEKFLSKK